MAQFPPIPDPEVVDLPGYTFSAFQWPGGITSPYIGVSPTPQWIVFDVDLVTPLSSASLAVIEANEDWLAGTAFTQPYVRLTNNSYPVNYNPPAAPYNGASFTYFKDGVWQVPGGEFIVDASVGLVNGRYFYPQRLPLVPVGTTTFNSVLTLIYSFPYPTSVNLGGEYGLYVDYYAADDLQYAQRNPSTTVLWENTFVAPLVANFITVPPTPPSTPGNPTPPPPVTGSVVFATSNFNVGIISGSIHYGLHSASVSTMRRGIMANAITGSPQLSFEPVTQDPTEILPGDMWFLSSSISGGQSSWMLGESAPDGRVFKSKAVVTRLDESSSAQLVNRYATSDAPSGLIVPVNAVVASDWFVTVNSLASSGSGWKNESWGGGVYMPNIDTVAIYGSKDFWVPSGSARVRNNLTVTSGTLNVQTGSILVPSGNVTIQTGSFTVRSPTSAVTISGSAARLQITGSAPAAYIRGFPVLAVISGSTGYLSVPSPLDGFMYVDTVTEEIAIRVNGAWIPLGTPSGTGSMDGGTY
jgi:hypothetical protein